MNTPVDAKAFDLHPSTKIEQIGKEKYIIIIRRKSRIVMKDGRNILVKVAKVKSVVPAARVGVQTTAPVCSKTKKFLQDHGVDINPIS